MEAVLSSWPNTDDLRRDDVPVEVIRHREYRVIKSKNHEYKEKEKDRHVLAREKKQADEVFRESERKRKEEERKKKKGDEAFRERERKRKELEREQMLTSSDSNSLGEFRLSERKRHQEYRTKIIENQLNAAIDSNSITKNATINKNLNQKKIIIVGPENEENTDVTAINQFSIFFKIFKFMKYIYKTKF